MNSRIIFMGAALLGSIVGVGQAAHAALSISDVPLFLRAGVSPNVVMTLDDSGSMARGYVPDDVGDSSAKRNSPRFTSPSYNALYYNPAVTYAIPVRTDGVTYSTSFTAAYVNGFDATRGSTNLSLNGYRPIYSCEPGQTQATCTGSNNSTSGVGSGTTTATNYSYTCTATFYDNTRRNRERIELSNCSPNMPVQGADGSPEAADSAIITVTNALPGYNKNYQVSSSSTRNGTTTITLTTANQISGNSPQKTNVTFSWSQTDTAVTSSGPAYYHLYYTQKPGAAKPTGCNDSVETNACYIYVKVGDAGDIFNGDAVAKKQNFAIWYSFYRTRSLAVMSAAMNAVTGMGRDQVRLGWQTINNGGCDSFGTSCTGYDGVNHENRIRSLDAFKTGSSTQTHRTDFYNWVAKMRVGSTTPLRGAMNNVGVYFSTSGQNSPYAEDPYVRKGTELTCRRNFHLMLTDGLWNSNSNANYGGNVDSTSKTLPDGTAYTPRYPYRSAPTAPLSGLSYSNNLADIAFKYWSTDLRSDLNNNLTPYVIDRSGATTDQYWNPRNNPATWQHMVNYTISLGLGSVLTDPLWAGSTYAGDYPDLATGAVDWPATDESPTTNSEPVGHVYDLWHAAINSRGEFFNADNPTAVAEAFQSAFASILTKNPSSSALAANSTSVQTGTMVYQAKYDSADWHGQLLAYPVDDKGNLGVASWDAAEKMPTAVARNITTWNGSQGTNFADCSTSTMTAAQKALLDKTPSNVTDSKCAQRLAWLRGDSSLELRKGGTYRDRITTVLGDLVNSAPVFVKNEDFGYAGAAGDMPEKATYASFVSGKSNRLPMVYVGGNDGMLHAFRADAGATDSGKEMWAHIPGGVYDRLNRLMEPTYSHVYYVDGSPSAGDAYINGSWKTVLVSGLAGGGRSIFAIDVSNPEAHGANKVLWEYTDSTDLGLTYSQPQIARLNNGQWAAIFGNGYNSTSGRSYLYVVNLSTGALIKKIVAGAETSNGLSSPTLYDSNGDMIIDTVYAGDLQGNLWKFDLSASSTDSWGVGNGGLPLFQTPRSGTGQVTQPITIKPAVAKLSGQPIGGAMVLFGTGSYITTSDSTNTDTQAFYAIWDNNTASTVTLSQLQAQTVTSEGVLDSGKKYRLTSQNAVDWLSKRGWFLTLQSPGASASSSAERVVANPLTYKDRVIFVTMVPLADDPCSGGGKSWFMELNLTTGNMFTQAVIDLNGDGLIDQNDMALSGIMDESKGIQQTPVLIRTSEGVQKEISGSSANANYLNPETVPSTGSHRRIFWQQLQ